jgi:hypothetical protein
MSMIPTVINDSQAFWTGFVVAVFYALDMAIVFIFFPYKYQKNTAASALIVLGLALALLLSNWIENINQMERARRVILFEPVAWSVGLSNLALVLQRLPAYNSAKENQW